MGRNHDRTTMPSTKLTGSIMNRDQWNFHYRFEANRLDSFVNWHNWQADPGRLAAAGFYYTGVNDVVRCFECHVELDKWRETDDPVAIHELCSSKCRFVRNIPCGNTPIGIGAGHEVAQSTIGEARSLEYDLGYDSASLHRDIPVYFGNSAAPRMVSLEDLVGSKYPEYARYEDRLRSFETWPATTAQTKEQMASAGFYYSGKGDETICYYCGLGLFCWSPNDDPVEEHLKYYSNCEYIIKALETRLTETGTGLGPMSHM